MAERSAWQLRWRGFLLSAFVVVAVSAAVGWLAAFEPAAPDESFAEGDATYPVMVSTYDDARTVKVLLQLGEPVSLVARLAGVVTAVDCRVGGVWESGQRPVAVSGRPLVAFFTSVPLYRDLVGGETGADVSAVQAALNGLGYQVAESGRFDSATRAAVAKMFTDRGIASRGSLSLSDVLWLPAPTVTLQGCPVGLGADIGGGAVATATGAINSARFVLPEGLTPGKRTLRVDEFVLPVESVEDAGLITDPALLAELAKQPSTVSAIAVQRFADAQATPQVNARLSLDGPIDVAEIPPSAIFDLDSTSKGCVTDGTANYPLTVVSSLLGLAYVTFEGVPPSEVVLQPSEAKTCD